MSRCEIGHAAAVHRSVTRALFKIEPGSWKTRSDGPDESDKQVTRKAFRFQVITRGTCSTTSSARTATRSPPGHGETSHPSTTGRADAPPPCPHREGLTAAYAIGPSDSGRMNRRYAPSRLVTGWVLVPHRNG